MSDPVIMVSEGRYASCHWRQYFVITDARCAVVEMTPALWGGWRFHSVMVQSDESWRGMTRDQIVQWKIASGHPVAMAPDLGDFRGKLLAVADSGAIPERK